MSGEAHPRKCCEGCPHENNKETSGNCPDKKKVNNGETGDCSRKEHCEKSNVCKDCGRPKKKAKEGSGHVNEPLTKEQLERLDAQPFIIRTDNHHYYVKTIGGEMLVYDLISSILGENDEMLEYIFRRSRASIAIITDLRAMQYQEAIIEFSGTAAEIKEATRLVSQAIITKYPVDSVPEAMLPENILHGKMALPKHQAGHFIGKGSLVEIEAASSTWLKLEESDLPADGKTGMIDILISGTLENYVRAKTMINKIVSEANNQKAAKPPKMFEFSLGDFRWKWIRGAAHKRFEWGYRSCAVKTQTGEDKKPTDNVDNSIEVNQVPAVAEVNNQVPIDAGREVGPSMSYTGGGDRHYVNAHNAGYYTVDAGAYSVGAYGEYYPSGYWVGGCS
ncbi:leucine-rich repeat-containing protein [Tanacetum coccineum]